MTDKLQLERGFAHDARWQRCVVFVRKTIHWIVFFPSPLYRNVFSLVPSGKVRDVPRMLNAIHAREDRKAAAQKMKAVIADLRAMKLVNAEELLAEHGHETLTYYYGVPDSAPDQKGYDNQIGSIIEEATAPRSRVKVSGPKPHVVHSISPRQNPSGQAVEMGIYTLEDRLRGRRAEPTLVQTLMRSLKLSPMNSGV